MERDIITDRLAGAIAILQALLNTLWREQGRLPPLVEEPLENKLLSRFADLERKLLEPKRFIVFYAAPDGDAEYTRHVYAHSVRDAFDQFTIANDRFKINGRANRVMHIEPWTESCEEWRPWESHPFPLGKK